MFSRLNSPSSSASLMFDTLFSMFFRSFSSVSLAGFAGSSSWSLPCDDKSFALPTRSLYCCSSSMLSAFDPLNVIGSRVSYSRFSTAYGFCTARYSRLFRRAICLSRLSKNPETVYADCFLGSRYSTFDNVNIFGSSLL